jgi:hypothetical protein
MASSRLTQPEILRLFDLLNAELAAQGTAGELHVVGGAVMCLAFGARDATQDVDALFQPMRVVREAAARVGAMAGVGQRWLNDAVRAYLSPKGDFDRFLELSHLQVFVAHPAYLLAMKCIALRLGEEFHDLDDLRYLIRHLDVTSTDEAVAIVSRYFDADLLLPKTRLILDSLFDPT